MKGKILLFFLLVAAIALSGCTSAPETVTVTRYVCEDGTTVSSIDGCPTLECPPCQKCEECPGIDDTQTISKEFVQEEIVKANYCEVKEDCALTKRKCPFGCNVFVNQSELEYIDSLIDEYKQRCVLNCAELWEYDCVDSICVEITQGS